MSFRAFDSNGLCRIPRNGPEAPEFFARVGIVSGNRSADSVIGAVVTHEHHALGHVGRVGDAGLCRFANRRLPKLFAGSRIDRNQSAIARADEDFALPHGDAGVGARRVRTVERLIQSHFGIELPNQFPRGGVQGVHLRLRSAHVGHAIDDDRFGDDPHGAVDVEIPGQAQAETF